jgi:cellobiose-specific phosphotransferase system component IIB
VIDLELVDKVVSAYTGLKAALLATNVSPTPSKDEVFGRSRELNIFKASTSNASATVNAPELLRVTPQLANSLKTILQQRRLDT